jgi:hypothetical protein
MANWYVSWATGVDLTGDGTAALPFKTIDKATAVCSANDEVRVEKSGAGTDIGSYGFTDGSAYAYRAGDHHTDVAAKDIVGNDTIGYYQVSSVSYTSPNTRITLTSTFHGAVTGTYAIVKNPHTDTGTAAAQATNVQLISGSGSDTSNRIKISGGWNLANPAIPVQDGITRFYQSGANQYGTGLYATGKSHIEISKIEFARYYIGLYIDDAVNSHDFKVSNVNVWTAGSTGIIIKASACDFDDIDIHGVITRMLDIQGGGLHTFTNIQTEYCYGALNSSGIYMYQTHRNSFTNIKLYECSYVAGLYLSESNCNKFNGVIISPIAGNGILLEKAGNNIFAGTTELYNAYSHLIAVDSQSPGNIFYDVNGHDLTASGACVFSARSDVVFHKLRSWTNISGCGTIRNDAVVRIHDFTYGGFYANTPDDFLFESTDVYDAAHEDARVFITKVQSDITSNIVHSRRGSAITDTVTVKTAGSGHVSWKMTHNTIAAAATPFEIEVGKYGVAAGAEVTINVWVKKSVTGMTARLICKGGQLNNVASDVTDDAGATTDWDQLAITMTPTEAGVLTFHVQVWGGNGTTDAVYVDETTFAQA